MMLLWDCFTEKFQIVLKVFNYICNDNLKFMKKTLTFFCLIGFTSLFAQISITTNIPSSFSAGSSVDAEVKINKGSISNFAKYQMDVPTGFVVTSVDAKGGNFTFENQRAKIVWVSMPSEPEIGVKFKIQATSTAASEGSFVQKFYYLENNEKKEFEATPIVLGAGGTAVAVNNPPVTETKPVETKVTETKPVETKVTETKPVETKVTETKPVETKVTETKPVETKPIARTTSVSEEGMTYKVQLGAFSSEPNKARFSSVGKINVDFINGLYKVTTGNFTSKEEAIKFCSELVNKGMSGFVVKYKNGQRIN